MKNFTLLLLLLIGTASFSQTRTDQKCITGSSIITGSDTEVYQSSALAQAYYWSVSGDLQIVGSNTGQSVSVKCTGSMQGGTLSLTRFKDGNCFNCSKVITCEEGEPCPPANAYFTALHDFANIFKTTSTITPSGYSSIVWSTNESRVSQINPSNGTNPVIVLTSGPYPVTLSFTATFSYPNGCTYVKNFSTGFSLSPPFGPNDESISNKMVVSPNPVEDMVNIYFQNKSSGNLKIYNSTNSNEIISENIVDKLNYSINTAGLKKGVIYQVVFTNDLGETILKKIVLE